MVLPNRTLQNLPSVRKNNQKKQKKKICLCSCEDSATFWPKQLNIQVQNAENINSVLVFYTTAYTVQSRTEATAGESLVSGKKIKIVDNRVGKYESKSRCERGRSDGAPGTTRPERWSDSSALCHIEREYDPGSAEQLHSVTSTSVRACVCVCIGVGVCVRVRECVRVLKLQ